MMYEDIVLECEVCGFEGPAMPQDRLWNCRWDASRGHWINECRECAEKHWFREKSRRWFRRRNP